LLDPRLVDPGSTLIYVGAYNPLCLNTLLSVPIDCNFTHQ